MCHSHRCCWDVHPVCPAPFGTGILPQAKGKWFSWGVGNHQTPELWPQSLARGESLTPAGPSGVQSWEFSFQSVPPLQAPRPSLTHGPSRSESTWLTHERARGLMQRKSLWLRGCRFEPPSPPCPHPSSASSSPWGAGRSPSAEPVGAEGLLICSPNLTISRQAGRGLGLGFKSS